jgi:RHS repeat-associated protein
VIGPGQYQLFRVRVIGATPLALTLQDEAADHRNEVYVRMGTPPSRSEWSFRATDPAAGQRFVVPLAAPGEWYVLVYTAAAGTPGPFRLTASLDPVVLDRITPDRVAGGTETVLTVTGGGFTPETTVELVDSAGAARAGVVAVHSPDRLTARFAAGTVPAGTYALRVTRPGGAAAVRDAAVTVVAGGRPRLETRLVVPAAVARHVLYSEIYVEYANRGTVAMPAPLLVLHATDKGLMTLDSRRLVPGGFFTGQSAREGFADRVQILASGATPGLLMPGESFRATVYWAGQQEPPEPNPIDFALTVSTQDQTDPVDWSALREVLRPSHVAADAWAAVFATLAGRLGNTWGQYVRMLNENAAYLGRLGQRVTDAAELFAFEILQATGLHPIDVVAASTDAAVETPGLPLELSRYAVNSVLGRYETGLLGRGWHIPWDERLVVQPDDFNQFAGTVFVTGPAGARRRFLYANGGAPGYYPDNPSDRGRVSRNADGSHDLREAGGLLRRFRPDGRLDFLEDLNGNRITATYTDGRLTRLVHSSGQFLELTYTPTGRIETVTDSEGQTTRYTYDPAGEHLTEVELPGGVRLRHTYGAGTSPAREHALTSVERVGGTTRFFEYDDAGRLTATSLAGGAERVEYLFDSAGTVTVRTAAGDARVFYDARGVAVQSEDALGRVTRLTLDDRLRPTRVTDPAGFAAELGYDSRGNLARVTDPLGRTIRMDYGRFVVGVQTDRVTAVTDANGYTTRFGYDPRGNRTSVTHPNRTVERLAFDPLGEVETAINRRGRAIDFEVNAAGQVTRKTYADGTGVAFDYDLRGNLRTMTGPDGTTAFEYDAADRLTRVNYPGGRFLEYEYDAAGRRTRLADGDGFAVNPSYDAAGRLERLTDDAGGLIARYTYDAAGRLSRKDLGGGGFATYEYDAAGQLLHLVNFAPGGAVHSRFDYTYDVVGRRTRMVTFDGTWDYEYDPAGQLTHATFASADPAVIPPQDLRYEYDPAGNRVRAVVNGMTTDYVANNLNQYVQVGDDQYDYDADGNLVSITGPGSTVTFAYDDDSRLVGASQPEGALTYEYDGLGNRTAATHAGQRTEYLIDPVGMGTVVGEFGGGSATHYAHGSGLVSRFGSAGVSHYEFDGLGSAVGVMAAGGVVQNRYVYAPFGEQLLSQETVANPFQFVGRFGVMHEENGLEFMRARFYTADLGRFVNLDPIRLAGGDFNLYRYAGNDPTDLTDPSGTIALVDDAIVIGIAALIGLAATNHVAQHGDEMSEDIGNMLDAVEDAIQAVYDAVQKALDRIAPIDPTWDPTSRPRPNPSPWESEGGADGGGSLDTVPNDPGLFGRPPIGPGGGGDFGGTSTPGVAPGLLPPAWPPFDPPPDPDKPGDDGRTGSVGSYDPNAKTGPRGVGIENFVRGDGLFGYRIDFENDPTATAPAQRVDVTDPLDPNLDWDTFEFTSVGFGELYLPVPAGSRHFRTTVDRSHDGRDFRVEIELDFDPATGLVRATFRSYDPVTGLPPDVLTGFLPPEDGSHRGQGHVGFVVGPRAGVPTGTAIRNVAAIRFDFGPVITTNQVDPHNPSLGTDPAKEALVTIDADAPIATVRPLPATVTTPAFAVSWSGTDAGSGVAVFDVFVSVDGGLFVHWLTDTTVTTAVYAGEVGRTYRFFATATDHVGLRETGPGAAEATTTVVSPPPPPPANTPPRIADIPDLSAGPGPFGPIAFGVADAETPAGELIVTARSSNLELVPPDGLVLGGSGATRTITVSPTPGRSGEAVITLTVRDGGGLTAFDTFRVAVEALSPPPPPPPPPPPMNTPPRIADVPSQSIPLGGSLVIPFTVGDDQTPADRLTLTFTTSDPELVPPNGVVLGGSDASRTVTVTPVSGRVGTAIITLTVHDAGGLTASDSFAVTVAPGPGTRQTLVGYREFAVGADRGSDQARLFHPDATLRFATAPFPGLTGGVRVAAADFTGDGVADLVAGTGPGGPTRVVVLDGVTGAELFAVSPFESSFLGGVFVAAGDLTGDGVAELVITPDQGGGPRVRVFDGIGFAPVADFFGIDDPGFRGGARAAVGDLNGDGIGDLVVAAGYGGGPRVAGYDGRSLGGAPRRLFGDFFAFESTLRNGVFVTTGDLDGDGFAEVIAGGGPGGGPRVTAFDGEALLGNQYEMRANFFAGDPDRRGGIRVAVKDLDGDPQADLVVGAGTGSGSRVATYLGRDVTPAEAPPVSHEFEALPGFVGGVFVG